MGQGVGAINKLRRYLAKRWNTSVFDIGEAANRMVLWNAVCRRRAIPGTTACLRSLGPAAAAVTDETVQGYLEELARCEALHQAAAQYAPVIGTDLREKLSPPVVADILFCYMATRVLRPSVVVETGCATGFHSALFLLALQRNEQGHLYSVDLPPVAGQGSMTWSLPAHLQVGFVIPQELRPRWTLRPGNSRTELIPLLETLRSVDMFYHDSDHTYGHMMWEYTSVWPYLSEHGVLISDDIGWHTAFWDFATAMRRPVVIHGSNTNFGALPR